MKCYILFIIKLFNNNFNHYIPLQNNIMSPNEDHIHPLCLPSGMIESFIIELHYFFLHWYHQSYFNHFQQKKFPIEYNKHQSTSTGVEVQNIRPCVF